MTKIQDFVSAKERLAPLYCESGWGAAFSFYLGMAVAILLMLGIGGV